jgi:hypothetical protein
LLIYEKALKGIFPKQEKREKRRVKRGKKTLLSSLGIV